MPPERAANWRSRHHLGAACAKRGCGAAAARRVLLSLCYAAAGLPSDRFAGEGFLPAKSVAV